MKIEKINLLNEKTEHGFMPTLTAYLVEGKPQAPETRPAVIVIPGGGYWEVSYREAERIALFYNAAGFNAFVLDYCTAPHKQPLPIMNVANSIKIIRENATEWNVDPEKIAVCGFSAGGHLAASISTLWNDEEIFGNDKEKNLLHRPNATILAYPVISSGEFAHKGSFKNLIGEEENELWEKYSLENQVNADTPPAFLWHTFEDKTVPVENSLFYASALRKYDIPFELHIYPNGGHGMARVSNETYWMAPKHSRKYPWMEASVEWLYIQFGIMNF